MNCPTCNSKMRPRRFKDGYRYTECGLSDVRLFGVEAFRCQNCKTCTVSIPAMDELHKIIVRSRAQVNRRLRDDEWRFLVEYAMLNLEEHGRPDVVKAGMKTLPSVAEPPKAGGGMMRISFELLVRGSALEAIGEHKLADKLGQQVVEIWEHHRRGNRMPLQLVRTDHSWETSPPQLPPAPAPPAPKRRTG